MNRSRFARPKGSDVENIASPNLFVANCGPGLGLSFEKIAQVFATFGEVTGVCQADGTGNRVIVCFSESISAQSAMRTLDGNPCPHLGDRVLHIRYSVPQPPPKEPFNDSVSVSMRASELKIPGLYLLHDFITPQEEKELLEAVDERPWKRLSKRRVQHYGYEFLYESRNVDTQRFLGELPPFVSSVLQKISTFPIKDGLENYYVDQLTVNEYPSGVGLSPHIDTHSAFHGEIFSLSLAGPCIMEFRKYLQGKLYSSPAFSLNKIEDSNHHSQKALFLPPRSMLLMTNEARYAWHHYIPHHKVDNIGVQIVKRGARRVSLTFRRVRREPCHCDFPEFCDSQKAVGCIRS